MTPLSEIRERAESVVLGAYRLSLSSLGNPVHPRNLEYHKKFNEEPLRYAVELLDRVMVLETQIEEKDEALKKIKGLTVRWMGGGNSLVRASLVSLDQIVDEALSPRDENPPRQGVAHGGNVVESL